MKLVLILFVLVALQDVHGLTDADIDNVVKLYFFYGPNLNQDLTIISLPDARSLLTNPHFKHTKTTVFFIHGYLTDIDSETVLTNAAAYDQNGGYNFVALKWDPLSNGSYLSATLNVVRVAARMTQVLADLHAAGLSFGKVHLVGHSLGAQMSGLIGSSVQSNSKNKLIIDRISALDPAGPLFYTLLGAIPILVRKVTSSDAVFVDVIHTDAGYLGEPNSCGHVDFWPCSGTRYAPCCSVVASLLTVDDQICSHNRCWQLWAASIILHADPTAFLSIESDCWDSFVAGFNLGSRTISMGINCPRDVSGDWFLQTSGEPPYSLGNDGLSYSQPAGDGLVKTVVNALSQVVQEVVGLVL